MFCALKAISPTLYRRESAVYARPALTRYFFGDNTDAPVRFICYMRWQRKVISGKSSENPANRGTEASAEVLVGPPGRMVSNAGQQQWYTRAVTRSRRRPKGLRALLPLKGTLPPGDSTPAPVACAPSSIRLLFVITVLLDCWTPGAPKVSQEGRNNVLLFSSDYLLSYLTGSAGGVGLGTGRGGGGAGKRGAACS